MKKTVFLCLIFMLSSSVIPVWAGGLIEINLPAKPYEIKWYLIGSGPQQDTGMIEAEANRYIQSKGLHATLKLVCFHRQDYYDKMYNIIASGEKFDICFTAAWQGYRSLITKGAFLKLNDLLANYAPRTKAALGYDYASRLAIDGNHYALPVNDEQAHSWGVVLRRDLVEKYRLKISQVKSLEDLEPFFAIIKAHEPGVFPFLAYSPAEPAYRLLDWDKLVDESIPLSLYADNRSSRLVFELEAPETRHFFKLIYRWANAGYIRNLIIEDTLDTLKSGRIFCVSQSLRPGKLEALAEATGFSWVQIPLTRPVISNREAVGCMLAISSTSEKPELVMQFIELFLTDRYLNTLINYGLEYRHFIKITDEIIKPGPAQEDYYPGTQWMLMDLLLPYLWQSEDPGKWQALRIYHKGALPLNSLYFIFNPEAVKFEIQNCQSITKTTMPLLEMGIEDPERIIPLAVRRYKAEGLDKILAEAQRQYDAWRVDNPPYGSPYQMR